MSVKIESVSVDNILRVCVVKLNWKRLERDTSGVEGTGTSTWGNVGYNNVSLNLFVRDMQGVENLKDTNTTGFKYFGRHNSQYHYGANDYNNVVCANVSGDDGLWKSTSNGLNYNFGEVTATDFQRLSINNGDITDDELTCALDFADAETTEGALWVTPETPSFFPKNSVHAYGIYYDFYSWGIKSPTLYSGYTEYLISQTKNNDGSFDFTIQIPWDDDFELGAGKYYISVVETYLDLFRIQGSTLTATYSEPWDVINSANIIPDPEDPDDQWLFTSGDAYTVNDITEEVVITYPKISSGISSSVNKWDWHKSEASAAAYNALLAKSLVSNFSHEVLNDLVNKAYEVIAALPGKWLTKSNDGTEYLDVDDVLMNENDKTLTAERFNSLKFNIGSRESTGINDVSKGDEVIGEYFLTLAEKINTLIDKYL